MFRFRLSSLDRKRSIIVQCVRLSELLSKVNTFYRGRCQCALGASGVIVSVVGIGIYALIGKYILPSSRITLYWVIIILISALLYKCGKANMRKVLPYLRQHQPIGVSLAQRKILAAFLEKSSSPEIRRIAFLLTRKEYDTVEPYGLVRERITTFDEKEKVRTSSDEGKEPEGENLFEVHVPLKSFLDRGEEWPQESELHLCPWENPPQKES